jgi:hypothetical protein
VTRLDVKSDSQANAEALARRSSTYADENARSWQFRFDRKANEPTSLGGYVKELRAAYADEMPERIHRHDVDGGGTPALSAEMSALLYGSPFATDTDDFYRYPFRACLQSMTRSDDLHARARIAAHVAIGGLSAVEAAILEGVPHWCAKVVATDALRVTWRRMAAAPLPPRTAAA